MAANEQQKEPVTRR